MTALSVTYKMNIKKLLILTLLLSSVEISQAKTCSQWEYANLSFTLRSSIKNGEVKDISTFVIWNAPKANGIWQNDLFLSGSIKKRLTEYLDIKGVDDLLILNKLGSIGWEAYGYHEVRKSDENQTSWWQFKKCVN